MLPWCSMSFWWSIEVISTILSPNLDRTCNKQHISYKKNSPPFSSSFKHTHTHTQKQKKTSAAHPPKKNVPKNPHGFQPPRTIRRTTPRRRNRQTWRHPISPPVLLKMFGRWRLFPVATVCTQGPKAVSSLALNTILKMDSSSPFRGKLKDFLWLKPGT